MGDISEGTVRRRARAMTVPVAAGVGLRFLHGPPGVVDLMPGRRPVVVGRGENADLRIGDQALSRLHFALVEQDGAPMVADVGSTNGTFVSGARVQGPTRMKPGDVLAAGDCLWCRDVLPHDESLPALPDADPEKVTELIGKSPVAERLKASLHTVAPLPESVLLLGPTGAGKEVAAQALHRLSGREGPFVPVNCAALPHDLAEAVLFGHVEGAYTGATSQREGLFRRAHQGTLFLDEIGELPDLVQAKLLRAVETGEVWPLGATRAMRVETRFIGATHRSVEEGCLRPDLYARLSDWVVRVPPLAERVGDAVVLLEHFLRAAGAARAMEPVVREALCLYSWPLNVREVAKLANRLRILVPPGAFIELKHLPTAVSDCILAREPVGEPEEPGSPTQLQLVNALSAAGGNVAQVAREGGWHRTQLYRWLERYAIDPSAFREI